MDVLEALTKWKDDFFEVEKSLFSEDFKKKKKDDKALLPKKPPIKVVGGKKKQIKHWESTDTIEHSQAPDESRLFNFQFLSSLESNTSPESLELYLEEIVHSPFPPKLIYLPSDKVMKALFKRAIERL